MVYIRGGQIFGPRAVFNTYELEVTFLHEAFVDYHEKSAQRVGFGPRAALCPPLVYMTKDNLWHCETGLHNSISIVNNLKLELQCQRCKNDSNLRSFKVYTKILLFQLN